MATGITISATATQAPMITGVMLLSLPFFPSSLWVSDVGCVGASDGVSVAACVTSSVACGSEGSDGCTGSVGSVGTGGSTGSVGSVGSKGSVGCVGSVSSGTVVGSVDSGAVLSG